MSPHHSGRLAPPRRNRENPSFSAALLDAIYHSLDADGSLPASPADAEGSPVPGRRRRPSQCNNLSPSASSVRSPRLQKTPRPCRVRPDPQPSLLLPPPQPPPPMPESTGDVAEKKRGRRKNKNGAKSAPFACLLNALLCNRRSARSAEPTTPRALAVAPAAVAVTAAEPASARSILSSRASRRQPAATGGILTPARRAVRFSPVAVVVDDGEHGCRDAGVARLRGAEREVAAAQESAAEAERRVEELLRALGVAEESERAKESSESSSDLFELESLPAFDDAELPRPRAAAGLVLARPRPRVC
ncbi:protein BIG GRAIN 1-like A [Oryza sativa Japonica Group]|uniref:Os02g0776600 protein n=2 Tax=Oryza sativa subsp. japonica TaxID=39947 RepID=C7IZ49_ORYSJ|nr:hypothetical protein EE612_013993 [Oryza sativa]KAF2947222.1 hypothetical protein DAI22_02g353700 [Oryza sativa Japonica Group]BAH91895.1 Os02g0776600 [Oryza sativa Japonica Group]BAS81170.1 Os02g0776600 [Oryza sativa Japonica Group]|eukprot:NP_001173166.1 Os02g0776600 [Oryza sativa Japonica Group]